MKCRLCDRPTAAGSGKLCTDCTKALQRARGAALRKLSSLEPEGATRAAAIDLPLAAASLPVSAPPSRRRAVLAAIALATIAILYVGQRELARSRSADALVVERAPAEAGERLAVDTPPVVGRVEEPSWTALGDPNEDRVGSNRLGTEVKVANASASASAATKPGARAAPKNAGQDSKSSPFPVASEPVAAPAPEPPVQIARVNVAPQQPVDGAQVLASAMEKCGSESLLSKFMCEQKTYLQYCEDKWDKDPRCVRRTASN